MPVAATQSKRRSPGPAGGQTHTYCGLDFGTSNSTVCLAGHNAHDLVRLDGTHESTPSAVFFNFTSGRPMFGREAISAYKNGERGRYMRGLKSVLGHTIFREKTQVQRQYLALADILAMFLRHLKHAAEAQGACQITDVVFGRPVQFVEYDSAADKAAEEDLRMAAKTVGFKRVEFQFEPIAAALEYESRVAGEEMVLVVDIGGGTSDFSIVRVSPTRAKKADRSGDILANQGIRVGGTDFDRVLSLRHVMPKFGMGSAYGDKRLEMPRSPYVDLSTWSKVNALYEPKTVADLKSLHRLAHQPDLLARLLKLIEERDCHRLLGDVEAVKIELSELETAELKAGYVASDLNVAVTRPMLEGAIEALLERVEQSMLEAVAEAGLQSSAVDTIFLTGGSSMALPVQQRVAKLFPAARVSQGDMLGSVGKGLGLDARRRFM
jgi:hypothetical chaperone protein